MIGIIFISDLKYCPYLEKYIKALESQNINYEVLFWNRENLNNKYPSNYKNYAVKSKMDRNPFFKLKDFYSYSRWLKKTIKSRKYEKLILLSTLSGIIVADTLLTKYKNKYIFDIRDYSFEHLNIYYSIEKLLIENSRFTCISSEGFKNFLPSDYNYKVAHNFSYSDIDSTKKFIKKGIDSKITIGWIGVVRYYKHQSEILNQLKNDNRFSLIYHGTGPDLKKLKDFCEQNSIKNVTFTGVYDNENKKKLLKNVDILNNSYGEKNTQKIEYAIANKYYDSLNYRIPQLVETESYKCKKVYSAGVGIGLNVYDESFADNLFNYYHSLNEDVFNGNCEKEINKILKQDKDYLEKIKGFILE